MTLTQIRTEVSRRLNEESNAVFWTDTDIDAAINEGYQEISDAAEWYERVVPLTLTGITYYDLTTNITDEFLSPKRAFNVQTNRWLKPVDVRDLDNHTYIQWENNQGEPQMMLQRGLWWFGTYPKTTGGTVNIYYTAIPPILTTNDSPGFPREFHYGLMEYAIYDLLCQEGETAKALAYWGRYLEYQEALHGYVNKRTSYDRVGILGG